MNIRMDEDLFAKNAQGTSKIYHEVLLLTKFQRTKRQVKNINKKSYDLFYTVIKNRDDKASIDDKNGNNGNDYNNFNDFITTNHNISNEPRETILR